MENSVDKRDPLAIAESFGIKTFRRSSRNIWTAEEDLQLVDYLRKITGVSQLLDINAEEVDWELAATVLAKDGVRKAKDLKKRWTTSLDPNLRKGKWTKEEDNKLIEAYEKFGPSWQRVSNYLGTRTTDQCAKRYTEVLDPKTKDRLNPWTREEELLLIRQIGIHGTKWRTVAAHFDNRPALTCRNKWRNIALNVAKDKVDPLIKQEVDKIIKNNSTLINGNGNNSITISKGSPSTGLISSRSPGTLNSEMSSPESSVTNSKSNNHTQDNPTFNNGNFNGRTTNHNQTEWKYTLVPTENSPDYIPTRSFGANGVISDEAVVNQLCQYAKSFHLNIEIHQHIHHHYAPPPHPFNHVQPQSTPPTDASMGFNPSTSPYPSYTTASNSTPASGNIQQQKSYFLEPEAQLNRFQHFNYLPPLTEVPKLTSSNSPNSTPPQTITSLNRDKDRPDKIGLGFRREDSPASLTPLTQAVELAAAEEMTKKRKIQDPAPSTTKKPKRNRNYPVETGHRKEVDEEENDYEEEGLDFWEQMRNLTDLPQNQLQNQTTQPQNQKPVSQHHPLHYFGGNVTPQPQSAPTPAGTNGENVGPNSSTNGAQTISSIMSRIKAEDEDDLKAYGMLYRSYSKSRSNSQFEDLSTNIPVPSAPADLKKSEETLTKDNDNESNDNDSHDLNQEYEHEHENPNYVYENLLGSFGMMPFNPS